MPHGVSRAGLAVSLDLPYQPYDNGVVLYPRQHGELGRTFFHELVHVWQVLSQAYMTRMAAAEWGLILHQLWAATFPLRRFQLDWFETLVHNYHERSTHLGLSPHDLTEGLARYWDVLVTGPDITHQASKGSIPDFLRPKFETEPQLEMDEPEIHRAMGVRSVPNFSQGRAKFTGEQYYFALTDGSAYTAAFSELCSSMARPQQGLAIFPLLAHFCLQTPDPVRVFANALSSISEIAPLAAADKNAPYLLQKRFAEGYLPIKGYVLSIAHSLGFDFGDSMWLIENSELRWNTVFLHHFQILLSAYNKYGLKVDYWFSAPGWWRAMLAQIAQPPVTRLIGGRWLSHAPLETQVLENLLSQEPSMSEPPPPSNHVWGVLPAVTSVAEIREHNADRSSEIAAISNEFRFERLLRRKRDNLDFRS